MSYDPAQAEIEELGYLIAEASRNVVFVVGAGLSMPANLPGWTALNQSLTAECINVIEHDNRLDIVQKKHKRAELCSIKDPWILGDELEHLLPHDRYVGTVRKELSTTAPPPETYAKIVKLNPSGIVSFNLDVLAQEALGGTTEQVATALDEPKYQRFLLLNRPFLFQPHGTLSNPASWVLGLRARNRLLRENKRYRDWIGHLLTARRLVIVGFRPRDFSFESLLLEDFRSQLHSNSVDHFWIVPEPSAEDRRWAADYHLKVIGYAPSDRQHPEILDILRQLETFKPRMPQPGLAYEGPSIAVSDLPPDDELRKYPIADIRHRLNAALKGATDLLDDYEAQLAFMSTFMKQFSASVHMAWHVKEGPYSHIWGYNVVDTLGKGGFGYVWKVEDVVDGGDAPAAVEFRAGRGGRS